MRSNPRLTLLSDEDRSELTGILGEVEAAQVALAAAEAAQARVLAAAGAFAARLAEGSSAVVRDRDMALRGVAAEIAAAVRLSDRSVQRQIDTAYALVNDYPATVHCWEKGLITRAHVAVVEDVGRRLPPEVTGEFDQLAAEICLDETPGRARADLEILAERMHPRTLTERHAGAFRERRIVRYSLGEGMSELRSVHSTVLVEGIFQRVTDQANEVIASREPGSGDTRSLDEVRADVFADMLLTSAPSLEPTGCGDSAGGLGAITAKVQVVIPVMALMGQSDVPCDLAGVGPIDAETARLLAGNSDGVWERLLVHPVTGLTMAVDQYRPTGAMVLFLKGRDKHCRWPGCRMPARTCEVDHNHDAALGGRTEICNLCCLCQRHHSMKQFTAWKVKQLDGGVIEWTSPTGRVYTDNPPGHGVHFSPEEDVPDDLWVKWTTFTGEFRITDEPADDPHEPAPF
ncbi:HNH endonuclease signature motif containing protein [Microbacterium sp. ABRD28]|uniref:HNH endonuclease n=1 Tax=Microbacterium sp. ABRD28 TaxID=2268461 RepID=UPI000F552F6A|nr:HNH endonuclease signature motif containing protein [Microbacterium sp. ABRD28]AZC14450.1 HNH endonuclease [Microbacterium sp. ABRD28]